MKLFVLMMIILYCLSGSVLCNPIDNAIDKASDKVSEKMNTTIDAQTEKLTAKLIGYADKGFDWIVKKILDFMWLVTQIISIIGIGWLLSFLCDPDSRKMVRFLVVLCVISLMVDKLINILN